MLVAVVALAVLAGLLALLLVRERARSGRLGAAADAALADAAGAQTRADEAAARADSAEARADAAESRADAAESRADAAEARADAAEAGAEQANLAAETAGDRALDAETERIAALGALQAAEQQLQELADRAAAAIAERDELVAQTVPLRERLLELEARSTQALEAHRPGIEAAALWELELARSERTWRHSVAPGLDGPGPFADTDDALRTAVEIEVSALREDVGAAMELSWDTQVDDPARCLTILRLAQELLAAAAREQQAVILRAHQEPDGRVVLLLTVPEGHPPVGLTVPPLGDNLVSTRTPEGLQVTVR